jgi:hypothetical protein
MTPDLDRITREIHHFEDLSTEHAECAVRFKAEIGRRLVAAKDILPHGQFMPWVKKNFAWDHSHVTRHMTLARNYARVQTLPPDASLRMALEAISSPRSPAGPAGGHPRFAVTLSGGQRAVLELKTGDPEQLCKTFDALGVRYLRVERAKAA